MPSRITIIDDKFYEKIVEYCKLNGLKISEFCTNLLKEAFALEQYGDVPFGLPETVKEWYTEEILEEKKEELPPSAETVTDTKVDVAIPEEKPSVDEHNETPKEEEVKSKPKRRRL